MKVLVKQGLMTKTSSSVKKAYAFDRANLGAGLIERRFLEFRRPEARRALDYGFEHLARRT